jgi:hypothetical protein
MPARFSTAARRIEREILAIAPRDQLHADRLALMPRGRHHRGGQAEHVDGGNATQIGPEDLGCASPLIASMWPVAILRDAAARRLGMRTVGTVSHLIPVQLA